MDYPHYNKMVRMLQFLSRAQAEVREQYPEETRLHLNFYHGDQPARLQVSQTGQDVAEKLGISGSEAIGLLDELAADDYIDLHYGPGGSHAGAGVVTVIFRQKGRAAIMEVPNPSVELERRLEAVAVAIEGLQNVDPAERERAATAARELKTFGRGLAPPAAIELTKRILTILGLGG